MAYKLDDKTLRVGQAFSTGGNNYPKNWLQLSTQEDKDALGITWEDEPVRADDTYYWNGELDNPKAMEDVDAVDEDGNQVYVQTYNEEAEAMVDTDKKLVTHGLKYQMTNQVKQTAGSILAQTDWYVTRKTERDVAIPKDVVAKRTHVVAESDRLETAIAGAKNVEALITVMNEQNWENE
tara:strand:+ start:76 stop:615 length:540 start_codon:yes stop_codon:yes gene_type:complete